MRVVAAVAVILAVASIGGTTPSSAASSSKPTFTIGVLADLTGVEGSSNAGLIQGLNAGVLRAKQLGYNIKYVTADTGTSPAQAQAGAQELVDEHHVFAVIANSVFTYLAAPFLKAHGIPVIGEAEDGPEWITDTNMFSPDGPAQASKVATTFGLFFKKEGVTNVGSIGYAVPAAQEAARAWADSAEAVGLRAGYVNTSVPLGTVNVESLALAMKSTGVNGLLGAVAPSTMLAILTALQQVGVTIKATILPYSGSQLTSSGAAAIQAAQGTDYFTAGEPMELHTAATKALQKALRAAGIKDTQDPLGGESGGYLEMMMLVTGLQLAGSHPTQARFISALNHDHNFNDAGLLGSHTLNISDRTGPVGIAGVDNCLWFLKFQGSSYHLIPGAEPLCGKVVKGVSAA